MNNVFDKEFFNKLNNISINLNLKLSKGSQGILELIIWIG